MRFALAATIGVSALVTGFVAAASTPWPAARSPQLQVAVETSATVIAALAALLVYGRYAHSRQRSDLLLTASLVILTAANLGLSAVPAVIPGPERAGLAWTGVLTRDLAAALMAAAAFTHASRPRPGAAGRLLGIAVVASYGVAMALVVGKALPEPVTPGSVPIEPFVEHPALAIAEVVMAALFGAAAIGFARRATRDRDGLMAWFAVGSVFAAFSRLNYMMFPMELSAYFAVGDLLRLAWYICLLLGGAAEIRRVQRALAAAAVSHERERIARNLHDTTAQDLAFIVQVGRRLASREETPAGFEQLLSAAQHALDTTRNAVSTLWSSGDAPLTDALSRSAHEIADREGVQAEVEGPADLRVAPAVRDALSLLVREAVTNAIRHGEAGTVRVIVDAAEQLSVRVEDDGRGFDPAQLRLEAGRFGIYGMDRRVAELGGELTVSSTPGAGTQVIAVLP
jgi:signal transduction histidine kinase